MKKIIIKSLIILLIFSILPINNTQAADLSKKLAGKILLQVESRGEAWYINPKTFERIYMANGDEAYNVMRNTGIGITNTNLDKLQNSKNHAKKYSGKIFLQVEDKGQAYYVNFDGALYYLKDGESAYEIMRNLGLGITNKNLEKIKSEDHPAASAADICTNIEGIQKTVPSGMTATGTICTIIQTEPTDICTNIEGIQTTVPSGMTATGTICTIIQTEPTDICTNIEGIQTTVPSGMTATGTICTITQTEPTDMCPNIIGIQVSIPNGMIINSFGNCVAQAPIYTQPLTAIMTFHPNLPNYQYLYMYSLYHNDCQHGYPASCRNVSDPFSDGLKLGFQDTLEPLNINNYAQHSWKSGEKVIVTAFTARLVGLDIDNDLSNIKFYIDATEKQVTREGSSFIYNGSTEFLWDSSGSITVKANLNTSSVGKNLQVIFDSVELKGKTTNLPITIPFSLPQQGRNYSIFQW